MATQKCPLCKKPYPDKQTLWRHVEGSHESELPQNWSGAKYVFYTKHKRTTGKCLVCRKETPFNDVTGKPERLCGNPMCTKTMRENAKTNMMKKYGTETLLNDPEFQNKMLMNRKIAKDYMWSDGTRKRVIGSFEYDGAQFLDTCLQFPSSDVIIPAPFIIEYIYEGEVHFYIPDAYITSLNLIIEFKDGGDNPNTHPKIQAVDKIKEKAKEDAIKKSGKYNYVKVENKQYSSLMNALIQLKNAENISEYKFRPVIITNEMANTLMSGDDLEGPVPEVQIIMFYERDLPFVTEVGIRVDNKIYVTRGDYLAVEELQDVIVTRLYLLDFPNSYKRIVRDRIDMFRGSEMNSEINAINSPLALLYEIFLPYDEIQLIEKGEAYDIFSYEDYEKFSFITRVEDFGENAFKDFLADLDNFDIDEELPDFELDLLPEEIIQEMNFPIKGLKHPVDNNGDFDRLVTKYFNNKIPDFLKENVVDFICNNYDKYGHEECPIVEGSSISMEELEPYKEEYIETRLVNPKFDYIKKLISNAESLEDIEICNYEIGKVNNEHDVEVLANCRDLKEVEIRKHSLV